MSKRTEVRRLLVEVFASKDDLRVFVEDHYDEIKDTIAWDKAMVHVAREVANGLGARGRVTSAFFDLLVAKIPGQESRIRAVQLEALLDEGAAGVETTAARLVNEPPDDSTLAHLGASLESSDGAGSTGGLQAVVSAGAGLGDPAAYVSGILNAMRRTAMVEIGGRPAGTGFLVGDKHLLTNAHVVGATTGPPAAGLVVRAVFDFYAGTLASHAELGRRVGGKVVAHSLPTAFEVQGNSSDWNAPATNLDYALIELDEPVALQPGGPAALAGLGTGSPRGHFRLSTLDYAFGGATFLLVTQHPLGEHLLISRAVGPFAVNGKRTRVRYKANTLNGSSGSSVLDERGRLVALHHFGRQGANQGVLMSVIAEDLSAAFPALVSSA